MNYQNRTKAQLIKELQELQQENNALKTVHQQKLSGQTHKIHFDMIVEKVSDGFWLLDKEFKTVFVNPALGEMLGYTNEEMIGRSWYDFGDTEWVERAMELEKRRESGVKEPHEFLFIHKDGRKILTRIATTPLYDKDGNFDGAIGILSDITQQKEALRESEERYRNLLTNLEAGIVVHASDTSIVMNNVRATVLLGLNDDQMKGKTTIDPAWKFVNEENAPIPLEEYPVNRILTSKKPIRNQILGIHQPGTNDIAWVSVNGFPALDNTGGISEIVISFFDITERKQAERSLKVSEERFTLAINGTGAGLWDWDMVKNEVVFSIQWKKMLGYEDNEVENSFMGWKNLWHPDDVVPIEKAIDDYITGKTNHYEIIHRCRNKNGDWQWILTRGDIVKDVQGKSCRWVGTNIDITKRKKAEEALRESEEKLSALFGSMTEMVALHEVVFNDHGEAINYRITDCNNAFTKVTRIKKEDAIGKLATEVYQSGTAPYLAEYSLVAMTGEPYEFTSYFAPMDKHFMISVVSPMKNHFATITTDITAIKQIQEIISDKNKELENYLYAASHDLRSPLVNIHGFSQRLQTQTDSIKTILSVCRLESEQMAEIDKIANKGIPKTLNFIFSNVTKMDTLLNGLLQISRTGRIKMTICKVDMNQLFKTIIASFNFQISEISAKVIIGDLPYCYGDENQLNQLFSNIIGNALKYREKTRQLVVEISGRTQYNKVTYSIKDTGIGIALRHLEKIWDVFYKVDVEGSEAGEGIGLSLAKRITEKHRGKAWAESEEGKGTTFHIELQKNEFSE
jgi:PAS domain S-box-containing protein